MCVVGAHRPGRRGGDSCNRPGSHGGRPRSAWPSSSLPARAAPSSSPAPSGGASVAPGASVPAASAPPRVERASAPATIPQGGTLSIGWNGEIQWLDPSLGYDVTSWPAERLMFEALLDYDEGTRLVPLLADGMPTVSADGKTYTFKIHGDVNFVNEDGSVLRQMTADDVAYSINRVLNPNLKPNPSPVARGFFGNIVGAADVLAGTATAASGIKVIDPTTDRVRPGQRRCDLPQRARDAVRLGRAQGTRRRRRDGLLGQAGRDGAVPVEELHQGPGRDLRQEPGLLAGRPAVPRPDRLQDRPGRQRDAPPDRGRDARHDGRPAARRPVHGRDHEPRLRGPDLPPHAGRHRLRVHGHPDAGQRPVQQRQGPPGGQLRDRQGGHPADHPRRRRRGELHLPARPARLRRRLQPVSARRREGQGADEGCRFEAGFDTTFYTDTTDPDPQIGASIQQDLAAIGIKTNIVSQEFATFLDTIETPHKAPIGWVGWFQDYPDPSDFIDPILSCASAVKGGANAALYCNKAVDDLAAAAKGETDPIEAARRSTRRSRRRSWPTPRGRRSDTRSGTR